MKNVAPMHSAVKNSRNGVPVAIAESIDQVQPDRPGHDREREDRVGEVVQRP
jgi:hypothetical protein